MFVYGDPTHSGRWSGRLGFREASLRDTVDQYKKQRVRYTFERCLHPPRSKPALITLSQLGRRCAISLAESILRGRTSFASPHQSAVSRSTAPPCVCTSAAPGYRTDCRAETLWEKTCRGLKSNMISKGIENSRMTAFIACPFQGPTPGGVCHLLFRFFFFFFFFLML